VVVTKNMPNASTRHTSLHSVQNILFWPIHFFKQEYYLSKTAYNLFLQEILQLEQEIFVRVSTFNPVISAVDTDHEKHFDEEGEKYFSSLHFNVSVFLPFTRYLENIEIWGSSG
jgi:hypothetical protein